jgi:3-hydroxybutyryl-CoA dehydrogenase
VARPFYGEALRIVEESVASPAEVDKIITGAGGFRMGPFALMDLVGLDVNLAVSRSVYEQSFNDPRFAPNQIQQQLVDAGRLGRKTGSGFYAYTSDTIDAAVSPMPVAHPVESVIVHGSAGEFAGLVKRLEAAGVTTTPGYGPAAGIATDAALLWPSDGRPVSAVDSLIPDLTLIAVDECVDWTTASAVAVAGHDEAALSSAAGVLAAAGIAAYRIDDGPGLVVLRTMAQLASVAADAVRKGVATAEDVDTAMRLGTNYPIGPLEWADRFGTGRLVDFLDNMADYYGEQRYRPSPLLRRAADLDRPLRGPQ